MRRKLTSIIVTSLLISSMFVTSVGAAEPTFKRASQQKVEITSEGTSITSEVSFEMKSSTSTFFKASNPIDCKAYLKFNNPIIGFRSASGSSSSIYKNTDKRAVMDEISVKVKYYKGGIFKSSAQDSQENASYAAITLEENATSGQFLGSHYFAKSSYNTVALETVVDATY